MKGTEFSERLAKLLDLRERWARADELGWVTQQILKCQRNGHDLLCLASEINSRSMSRRKAELRAEEDSIDEPPVTGLN